MRLTSYATPQRASFGVVRGEHVIDMGLRLGPACPDLKSALAQGLLPRIAELADGAPPDHRLDELVLLPVIPNPARILCAGLNYLANRLEGQHKPEAPAPTIFMRLPESQVGHGRPMVCPRESEQFDFEAELAVVIGRAGRRIPEAEAYAHVAGIAPYNDGSVRDWQLATGQWSPGKNFPATGAFGPWMVTSDEVPPDSVLSLVCRLNGREMQRTTTDLMIFPIPALIAFASTFTTLQPGDVIVTGTPGGVGLRRDPPVWMKAGDTVEIELERVGVLRNTVVKERA
jgi:2-keto-4-pentenoate hydratase/2-oxohepta-3-ene-1,7-dioic acid hydratase in catechol pathway